MLLTSNNCTFIHIGLLSYFRVMSVRKLNYMFLAMVFVFFAGCRARHAATSPSKGVIRKKMLVAAEIKSIQVAAMPRYGKDGEAWDAYAPLATDPDPFVRIMWNESVIYQSETKDNQPHGNPVFFEKSLPQKLVPFDQSLIIELFDEDGISANDNMGYVSFNPAEYHGKEEVLLSQGELLISLTMTWYYE
jgi:hypothetical protein